MSSLIKLTRTIHFFLTIHNIMYLLCMIKARIRWCTCRVENILTLGKLLSLWFCFLLHSILFFISQTSYRTYKIISSYELARPVMGTSFLVYINLCFSFSCCVWEALLYPPYSNFSSLIPPYPPPPSPSPIPPLFSRSHQLGQTLTVHPPTCL